MKQEFLNQPLAEAFRATVAFLSGFSEEAEIEARWLFQHVNLKPSDLRLKPQYFLNAWQQNFLTQALQRRHAREPLQHILGTQPFRYLELSVNANVLTPRPETEELVHHVLEHAHKAGKHLRVLDVGTGSGAIAVALKTECPTLNVWATDISEAALAVARENAQKHSADIHFLRGDGLNILEGLSLPRFDIIVSNPPYIPAQELADLAPEVVNYEPHQALVPVDPDALYFYKHFAGLAPRYLKNKGRLFLEIHAPLAHETAACFAFPHWQNTRVYNDLQQKQRFVESELGRVLE